MWPELVELLRQFNGLMIEFNRAGSSDTLWVDAAKAAAWADVHQVGEYDTQLRFALTPIGAAYSDHLILMAGADGRFYGGYDNFLAYLGQTMIELIWRLLLDEAVPIAGDAPGL